jgi:hypothetical protein
MFRKSWVNEAPVSDNVAFTGTPLTTGASARYGPTLQELQNTELQNTLPPIKPVSRRWRGRLLFWAIWLGIGGIWSGVKYSHTLIERFSPSLNAQIHDKVEDQSDVDYHAEKFWSEYKAYSAVSCDGLDASACAALLVAQRPVLDDI